MLRLSAENQEGRRGCKISLCQLCIKLELGDCRKGEHLPSVDDSETQLLINLVAKVFRRV